MKGTTVTDSPTESEVGGCAVENLQEQVRRRAYELNEERGKEDGHGVDDWLQAESELIKVATIAAA